MKGNAGAQGRFLEDKRKRLPGEQFLTPRIFESHRRTEETVYILGIQFGNGKQVATVHKHTSGMTRV